jgi:hypothetical protein
VLALLGTSVLPSFERIVAIHGGGFGMVLCFVLPIWAAIRRLGPAKEGQVRMWYVALGVSVVCTVGGFCGGVAGAKGGLGG